MIPQERKAPYIVSEESPPSRKRGGNLRKWVAAAAIVCVVAIVGFGGYQWLFADKDPADAKPSTVFDPEVEENPEQAAEWYRQSVEAKNKKQVAQAILLGRKAVSADPNKREYYSHLAEMYQKAGIPKALSSFSRKEPNAFRMMRNSMTCWHCTPTTPRT